MHDERLELPPAVLVAAYLLALLGLVVPLSVVGSTFAGVVLWQRGLRSHAVAVVLLGAACTALGVTVLR